MPPGLRERKQLAGESRQQQLQPDNDSGSEFQFTLNQDRIDYRHPSLMVCLIVDPDDDRALATPASPITTKRQEMHQIRLLAIIALLMPSMGTAAEVNTVFETSFESSKDYKNPFMELEVDVLFRRGKQEWRVPAFWDGGRRGRSDSPLRKRGDYTYRAIATDKANAGLNTVEQTLTVTAYTGDNRLYKHGKLRVTENKRYFELPTAPRFSGWATLGEGLVQAPDVGGISGPHCRPKEEGLHSGFRSSAAPTQMNSACSSRAGRMKAGCLI